MWALGNQVDMPKKCLFVGSLPVWSDSSEGYAVFYPQWFVVVTWAITIASWPFIYAGK